jgi:hypothetical protein
MGDLSFLDLYGVWTLLFVMVFGMIAVLTARDLPSMARLIILGTGLAPFVAGFFAIPMYAIIHSS